MAASVDGRSHAVNVLPCSVFDLLARSTIVESEIQGSCSSFPSMNTLPFGSKVGELLRGLRNSQYAKALSISGRLAPSSLFLAAELRSDNMKR